MGVDHSTCANGSISCVSICAATFKAPHEVCAVGIAVAVVSELLWSLLCTFVDICMRGTSNPPLINIYNSRLTYAGSTIALQEISWSTAALKTSDGVCAVVITGLIVTLVDIYV